MSRVKGSPKTGGRKKNTKNEKTIEKEKALELYQQAILKRLKPLMDAQFSVAQGMQIMLARDWIVNKRTKKLERTGRFVRIKDETEILKLLNSDYQEGDDYYLIFTTEPNARAIEDLINRVFGKPKENLDITSGGKPIPLLNNVCSNKSDNTNTKTEEKN